MHEAEFRSLPIGLLGELRLEVEPLILSELDLPAEVVPKDNLVRIGEVDDWAATLDATQLDGSCFGGLHVSPSFQRASR